MKKKRGSQSKRPAWLNSEILAVPKKQKGQERDAEQATREYKNRNPELDCIGLELGTPKSAWS